MTKIIPYSSLVRQQQLQYLQHKQREYQEREEYLGRVRRLLFQVEAQVRQAELLQLAMFQEMAEHFKAGLRFPDLGDRIGLHELFNSHPFLQLLKEFFAGRLTVEEASERINALKNPPEPNSEPPA
jgi:hypothetical protein